MKLYDQCDYIKENIEGMIENNTFTFLKAYV